MSKEVYIRGDRAVRFPALDTPPSITHARVIACRYTNWDAIGQLENLESLEVYEWLGHDLVALRPLARLEQLKIHHLPKVTSLVGLEGLASLRRLILETTPGWDSSGKVTQVDSLQPLAGLPLEEVNMFGVRPVSKSVDELLAMPTLRRARLSKFAAKEIKRINAVVPSEYVTWEEPPWGSEASRRASGQFLPAGVSYWSP